MFILPLLGKHASRKNMTLARNVSKTWGTEVAHGRPSCILLESFEEKSCPAHPRVVSDVSNPYP